MVIRITAKYKNPIQCSLKPTISVDKDLNSGWKSVYQLFCLITSQAHPRGYPSLNHRPPCLASERQS